MPETPYLGRSRTVETLHRGRPTEDGSGVRLVRLLDRTLQKRLGPFLMLDLFGSENPDDYLGGFPDHPHRGFETITYMIEGRMRHRDSAGHEGLLETGGMQWMCAARGVIHSEMPEQKDGRMAGFQLWLNLPARSKMDSPWYRDFAARDLPRFSPRPGLEVVVLAGRYADRAGAVERPHTEPLLFDVRLDRIDRLNNGSLLVIDYKTGNVHPKSWDMPRPDDVQLPLYAGFALEPGSDLGGLAFAKVRPGEDEFAGRIGNARATLIASLGATSHLVKNALSPVQLMVWREYIEGLARSFLDGCAEVDPRDYPKTCERCGLQSLCRVQENHGISESDGDIDDEEAADE